MAAEGIPILGLMYDTPDRGLSDILRTQLDRTGFDKLVLWCFAPSVFF